MTRLFSEIENKVTPEEPATATAARDIPLEQMQQWIAEDEESAEVFWKKAANEINLLKSATYN